MVESAWEWACESGWEDLQSDAEYVLGKRVIVHSAGRSGGWCVIEGLPDVETWDAIAVSKWTRFAKYAKAIVEYIPVSMVDLLYFNVWIPEHEAKMEQEAREAAEDAEHQLPYMIDAPR